MNLTDFESWLRGFCSARPPTREIIRIQQRLTEIDPKNPLAHEANAFAVGEMDATHLDVELPTLANEQEGK
jgi:hypothetical protein